jgi:hypothetical protein
VGVGTSSSSSSSFWREKGCGVLSLQISPILITVGPGFLQQRKEILGLASKKIINQSINQSIV